MKNETKDPLASLTELAVFEARAIKAVPIKLQAGRAGVRVKLTAKLGHIEIPMQIDVSSAKPGASAPAVFFHPRLRQVRSRQRAVPASAPREAPTGSVPSARPDRISHT